MTLATLKWLRFLMPGIIIILYGMLFIFLVSGQALSIPDLSKAPYLPIIVIPAAIYYVTPLRSWFNEASHQEITDKLRLGMVKISGYDDNPEKYTWKTLRSLFYEIIDGNKSLTAKASLAYFNGFLWTSFADSAAIATVYASIAIIMFFFDAQGWLVVLVVFLIIVVGSAICAKACVKKQIAIGAEQLEIMKFNYKNAITKRLDQT